VQQLQAWFQELSPDAFGRVTFKQSALSFKDPETVAFAATLDIDVKDLKQFFYILSRNGSRSVDLETFVVGCIRLRGTAKSMDVMESVLLQKEAMEKADVRHQRLEELCRESFAEIFGKLEQAQRTASKNSGCNSHYILTLPEKPST